MQNGGPKINAPPPRRSSRLAALSGRTYTDTYDPGEWETTPPYHIITDTHNGTSSESDGASGTRRVQGTDESEPEDGEETAKVQIDPPIAQPTTAAKASSWSRCWWAVRVMLALAALAWALLMISGALRIDPDTMMPAWHPAWVATWNCVRTSRPFPLFTLCWPPSDLAYVS